MDYGEVRSASNYPSAKIKIEPKKVIGRWLLSTVAKVHIFYAGTIDTELIGMKNYLI